MTFQENNKLKLIYKFVIQYLEKKVKIIIDLLIILI